jgi:ketosteroid isomerase-like protein
MIFPPGGRDLVEDSRLNREAAREALGTLLHPDFEVEWHPGGEDRLPSALRGTARGFDAYWDRYQDYLEGLDSFRIVPDETIELEDGRLVIPSRIQVRARHGGVDFELAGGAIWELEDGLIRRIDEYLERGELYRSAGIEPPAG